MFDKKQPAHPWYVQILTRDLSIEGVFNSNFAYILKNHLQTGADWLTNGIALLHPLLLNTGLLKLSETTGSAYVTGVDNVVCFIPRDQIGQDYVLDVFKGNKHTVQAICLAGPYIVRGQLHLDLLCAGVDRFCLVRDAHITRPDSPAQWPGLSVPLALLHPTWLQGYLEV